MTDDFLPFAIPDIGDAEIDEVVDTLKSGWVTTGPKVSRFEQDFAEYIGNNGYALAVNSGTAGLHLALEAIGVGPGDEVIVPTYTFTATAEVVRYLGADPVFVDVNPHTLNICADTIERAITQRTRAVIPVHFAGLSCELEAICELCESSGISIVEDAAHALPSTRKGRMIGAWPTDATVFSFYANKTMTTGEGGMIATRNSDVADRCKVMRLHGISKDAFNRYVSRQPEWYYEVVAPGYKYNMPDIAAAIGLHQLRRLDQFHRRRVEIANKYLESLEQEYLILPAVPDGDDKHAWHLFVVRLKEGARISRDEFIIRMAEMGIGCSVHFIPLHMHPYWRDHYRFDYGAFPNAEAAYESAVTLPLYTRMSDSDVQRTIDAVNSILRG